MLFLFIQKYLLSFSYVPTLQKKLGEMVIKFRDRACGCCSQEVFSCGEKELHKVFSTW